MKILVTGASGLLGFELCRQLKDAGHEVWAVDNLSRGHLTPPSDQFLTADLTDPIIEFDDDFDMIYHYSAINGTKNFYERPNHVLWNNMQGDFNLFRIASYQRDLKRFVYASTSEIVSGDPESPVTEKKDITIQNIHNARWSYRLPKICAENYLANSDLPWLALRYFNVYGSQSKDGHFVADQIEKIRRGVFEITGAMETRSFCHVTDAMRATIFCAEHAEREVINIGNDREISIDRAAQAIATAMGYPAAAWSLKPGMPGSTPNRRPDISRLRQIMPDYDPCTFEKGIEEVIANWAPSA
jgi:UDP-glucose 4-epimerase